MLVTNRKCKLIIFQFLNTEKHSVQTNKLKNLNKSLNAVVQQVIESKKIMLLGAPPMLSSAEL